VRSELVVRNPTRALARFLYVGAITSALLALLAVNATAASLSGSIGGAAKFPSRALVLSVPPGVRVSVPRIYVSENGKPVDHLSVTPVKAADAGDFGVVMVIDRSQSMRGTPLAQEMAAARAIAARRTGKQELGVISFAQNSTVLLPPTSDQQVIDRVLAQTPATESGTRILPALMAGLKQLADANVADGTVILVSDGSTTGSGGLTPQSVDAAAQAQHVRIFTVGLRDRAFTPGLMRQLAGGASGKFAAATAAQLPQVLTGITSALSAGYLLRYQSILSAGQQVALTVHVDGLPSLLSLSYYAPASSDISTSSSASHSGGTSSSVSSAGATSSPSAPPAASAHPAPRAPAATVTGIPGVTVSSLPLAPFSAPSPNSRGATASHPAPRGALGQSPSSVPSVPGHVAAKSRPSFWTSSLAALAIGAGCTLLIALSIAVLLFRDPTRRALQRRVHAFTHAPSATDPTTPTPSADGETAVATRLASGRRWLAFCQRVESARFRRSPLSLVKRWAMASIVAAFLLAYLTGTAVLGLLLLIVSPLVLKLVVSRGVRRQQRLFSEQLPSNLQDLAGAMRGGRSFVGAITAMTESATEPLRGEFQRALSDERLGLPLEDTLDAIGLRMEAKDMEQIALIAALQRGSGSNVGEALDRVADSSRERADLQREMRSLTAQARMSAGVLTGMPPLMLLALMFIAPGYQHPLFHTTGGIVLLFVGAGMLGLGWWVMSKIVNAEA
jgi:tight adherence protein B